MIEFFHPTPIGYYDISELELDSVATEIQSKEEIILNLLSENSWGDNVKSTLNNSVNILFQHNFEKTFSLLNKFVFKFLNDWYSNHSNNNVVKTENFFIEESWFNYLEPLGFQGLHKHERVLPKVEYLCSGAFFYDKEFVDNKDRPSDLFFDLSENCTFLTQIKYVTYKYIPGRIILFPARAPHRVLYNKTNQTRKSISFNVTAFC